MRNSENAIKTMIEQFCENADQFGVGRLSSVKAELSAYDIPWEDKYNDIVMNYKPPRPFQFKVKSTSSTVFCDTREEAIEHYLVLVGNHDGPVRIEELF